MITIELSQGYYAVIDDEDSDLAELEWCASFSNNRVYAKRSIWNKGKTDHAYLHKVIAWRKFGDRADQFYIDHRDTDSLNNRRDNIRLSTNSQNVINQGPRSDNLSGYKGVSKSRGGKWYSRIKAGDEIIKLGSFYTPEEAAMAYNDAAVKYYGEFAWTNPIDPGFVIPDRSALEDAISTNDLANRWGCNRQKIVKSVKAGKIKSFVLGHDLRVPMSFVVDFESRGEHKIFSVDRRGYSER